MREAPITIDFETLRIEDRPLYPPPPVGVAIRERGRSRYYAFGHLGENSATWGEAREALARAYDGDRPLLFHHAKFDLDVAAVHLGLPIPRWGRVHDTLPLLFLADPRAPDFALKPSAERRLGEKPEERDAVIDWLTTHQPIPGVRLSDRPNGKHYAGAYVAHAPAGITGVYACGDVDRTARLFESVFPEIQTAQMTDAYDRERRLLPHLLRMEHDGLRVDLNRLRHDVGIYDSVLDRIDRWIKLRLRSAELNVDSNADLVEALIRARAADAKLLGLTPTGQVATNKEALEAGITDPQIAAILRYRGALATCLRTFMRPWLATAERSGGFIFTRWHSTRSDHSDGGYGTRTGRLSSSAPNFQNLVKAFAPLFHHDDPTRGLPRSPIELPPLPHVRSYVIAYADDHTIVDRDYSQQELRILGHFEGDVLLRAYLADPWLDVHAYAQKLINGLLNSNFERKPIKNTGFGIIYGMGVGKLAVKCDTTVELAKRVRDAYLKIFPGLKQINADIRERVRAGKPIRTWDGRVYYCEPPRVINGRLQSFDYKLLNVLIQGSAAGCTKEALIRFCDAKPAAWKVLLTVHDEIAVSVPKRDVDAAQRTLREAMESVTFDVPMLSEGTSGPNLDQLEDYDKGGKRVH